MWSIPVILVLLFLFWLFLIAPRLSHKNEALPPRFAHRGLWGEGVPENSLEAFRRAAEGNFGIELDVQLSADGEVMVFHDSTLKRMCGRDVPLSSLSAKELCATPLGSTEHTVPTLREVLAAVDGKTPILVELKGESAATDLVPRLAEVMKDYKGVWVAESFNPLLLREFGRVMPHVTRGILVTDKYKKSPAVNFLLPRMLLNFLCRPDFIAFNKEIKGSLTLRTFRTLFRVPLCIWTIKNAEEFNAFKDTASPIFDEFTPD